MNRPRPQTSPWLRKSHSGRNALPKEKTRRVEWRWCYWAQNCWRNTWVCLELRLWFLMSLFFLRNGTLPHWLDYVSRKKHITLCIFSDMYRLNFANQVALIHKQRAMLLANPPSSPGTRLRSHKAWGIIDCTWYHPGWRKNLQNVASKATPSRIFAHPDVPIGNCQKKTIKSIAWFPYSKARFNISKALILGVRYVSIVVVSVAYKKATSAKKQCHHGKTLDLNILPTGTVHEANWDIVSRQPQKRQNGQLPAEIVLKIISNHRCMGMLRYMKDISQNGRRKPEAQAGLMPNQD